MREIVERLMDRATRARREGRLEDAHTGFTEAVAIAVGFLVLIGAAAVLGVLVGAIGGAVAWRLRMNLAVGVALTACA